MCLVFDYHSNSSVVCSILWTCKEILAIELSLVMLEEFCQSIERLHAHVCIFTMTSVKSTDYMCSGCRKNVDMYCCIESGTLKKTVA